MTLNLQASVRPSVSRGVSFEFSASRRVTIFLELPGTSLHPLHHAQGHAGVAPSHSGWRFVVLFKVTSWDPPPHVQGATTSLTLLWDQGPDWSGSLDQWSVENTQTHLLLDPGLVQAWSELPGAAQVTFLACSLAV